MHEGFEEEKKRRQEDRKRVAKGFNLSKLASMDDFKKEGKESRNVCLNHVG